MLQIIILVVLIWGGWTLYNYWRNRPSFASSESESTSYSSGELTVKDLGVGGVFTIRGFSEDFEDASFVISRKNRYSEEGYEWYELKAEDGSKVIWLEWEEDDELEVAAYDGRNKLEGKEGLERLNLTPKKLEMIDDEEEGEFSYEGIRYAYEDSGDAFFQRDCLGKKDRFYYWDFEGEDEEHLIGIEKWGAKTADFEVHIGKVVHPRDINILKPTG
ncbi:MAG: DUF4178 domain-containing protein [bacterium]|nr:DUF4178 domain-containing protein [bacterium]